MEGKKRDKRFGDHYVDNYSCSLSYDRKKRGRIRFLSWAIELYEYSDEDIAESKINREREKIIGKEVRKAVEKLSNEERQFIEKFYFEFRSYREIAGIFKKRIYKLERIHRRALDKLRILLADFVKNRFKLEVTRETDCVICNHPFRPKLDRLIRRKKKDETYARLIRTFKQKYGIEITTPQVIIGHQRKHMV